MINPFMPEKGHLIQTCTRSPLRFFLLVFALSIPFWVAGALASFQLLPNLPVSALMVLCPLIAAVILVYRENKIAGVTELLKRSFDYQRITAKIWYAPMILLMPIVTILSYALVRVIDIPLPAPQFPLAATSAMIAGFFMAGICEELGWSGFATDPLQRRWGALLASIVLGFFWAAWHIIPLMQAHRSAVWIAWWCPGTVATRIVLVWLYNNTGKSVFAAATYHAITNVCWQLFPSQGSHYDPRITSLIVTFIALVITLVWGPRTLARCPRCVHA